MARKAQGISINTIIITVLAIIVMVFLVLIFSGHMKNFRLASGDCENKGGVCKPYECEPGTEGCLSPCDKDNFEEELPFTCYNDKKEKDPNKVCCARG